MAEHHDERIQRRAHEIWEREGRPEGRQDEHWNRAAAEIDAENRTGAVDRDVPAQMKESLPEAPGVLAPDTVDTVRTPDVRTRNVAGRRSDA